MLSKNGNLLLDLRPATDGPIPTPQSKPLLGFGARLRVNGEAIYGSAYRTRAEDPEANAPVRYALPALGLLRHQARPSGQCPGAARPRPGPG